MVTNVGRKRRKMSDGQISNCVHRSFHFLRSAGPFVLAERRNARSVLMSKKKRHKIDLAQIDRITDCEGKGSIDRSILNYKAASRNG